MIEISFGKLVLLAIIALIVLGPEKLPGAARTAGALLRRVRSGWDNVRAEVERELQVEEIKRAAREASARADAAQAELDAAVQKVRDMGSEAQRVDAPVAAEPAAMRPLAAADAAGEGTGEPVADAVSDNRTGDLFAATKPPAESSHGHV